MSFKKIFWIMLGTISLITGIIGIFLPLLPTTPFLLLTSYCYIKGSEKFYKWLINNKFLGKYIKNYKEKKGISKKHKIITLSFLWIFLIISIIKFNNIYIKIFLIIVGVSVTLHITRIKTIQ